MDRETLKLNISSAVAEYLDAPEAWDDAMVAVNTETGAVELIEAEEADSLPDTIDEYDIMDFIEMNADGVWIADYENISAAASEY